jgi:hypothetical protein
MRSLHTAVWHELFMQREAKNWSGSKIGGSIYTFLVYEIIYDKA